MNTANIAGHGAAISAANQPFALPITLSTGINDKIKNSFLKTNETINSNALLTPTNTLQRDGAIMGEVGMVVGVEALAAKMITRTTKVTGGIASNITSQRKLNQLQARGWNEQQIKTIIINPFTTRKSINKLNNNSATVYYRKDGHYIVRDDTTYALVQISDIYDKE